MEISTIHSSFRAAELPLDRLAANAKVPEAEKIKELSRQFEAVLLRHILASAQKTVVESELTSESAGSDVYKDLVTNQLADAISRSGSFGFARSLERELSRQLTAEAGGSRGSEPTVDTTTHQP